MHDSRYCFQADCRVIPGALPIASQLAPAVTCTGLAVMKQPRLPVRRNHEPEPSGDRKHAMW